MEWTDIEPSAEEQLCRIEHFEIQKAHKGGHVPFGIAVREYLHPRDGTMKYVATADKQTNQRTVPFTPMGWGNSSGLALWECVVAIRRFPYEPVEIED